MTDDLEKLVNEAATLSVLARSEAARQLAARKRTEAREAINVGILRLGRLHAILNKSEETSGSPATR